MSPMLRVYVTARCRSFVTEIFQLHQRFLLSFIFFFGLILSGNEQIALRKSMVRLLAPLAIDRLDSLLLLIISGFSVSTSFLFRKILIGGRVAYFVRSLPIPITQERLIRGLLLGFLNLAILVLLTLGWEQSFRDMGSHSWSYPLWTLGRAIGFYALLLSIQLAVIEGFRRYILGFFLLMILWMLSKGQLFELVPLVLWVGTLSIFLRTAERRPIHGREYVRHSFSLQVPAALRFHAALFRYKPMVVVYPLGVSMVLELLLTKIASQTMPSSQRIYVFTIITGIVSLIQGDFYRSFHQRRLLVRPWLQSLPQPESWWLRQDTAVVLGIYGALILPLAVFLFYGTCLPLTCLVIIPLVHGIMLTLARRIYRLHKPEWGILLILLAFCWFILLGFLFQYWQGTVASC